MALVINIRKKYLIELGYKDFAEWATDDNHVYIGRNMTFYVPGTYASKWANPFPVKKFGLQKCLEMYEQYIRDHPDLYNSLSELEGKTLGCWCKNGDSDSDPEINCHGDILLKLMKEIKQ